MSQYNASPVPPWGAPEKPPYLADPGNWLHAPKRIPVRGTPEAPEYYVGATAANEDGWCSVPEDLRARIVWG